MFLPSGKESHGGALEGHVLTAAHTQNTNTARIKFTDALKDMHTKSLYQGHKG